MTVNKKRIELHCHSKAGGNATMYPGEIIRYLSEMEMPAFAITDESNIGAFPELERVWETGNYSARPIFGMEIMVENQTDNEVDYMSVLIKNEYGKKALYKMISENKSIEPYPVFQFEKLIESRDGLLLGSGSEKGHLYKCAMKGVSEKELEDIISVYDYIEVLPGKQFEEINKRIIRICDALKIPVVAISDARYFDKFGKQALKIMKHWNKEDEDLLDNHLWTTEEMLEAFDYLPEEKAYEIVVENTHFIADMCETISVCPKERHFPNISDANEKLRKKCYQTLEEKFPNNLEEAKSRLDWELVALEKTGMEFCVLQINELMNQASLKADDISLRGAAAGSMVAYLLGITNIDPLKYGLEAEIVFGERGEREIDIDLNIPNNRQLDVIERVMHLDGIGKYVWAGTTRSISDSLAQAMIEQYLSDNENYYDEAAMDKIRWAICGNYIGRGKHPGGIVVFPKECKWEEMLPIVNVQGDLETTYFDYHCVDHVFIKYDLLKHTSPEMLTKLEKLTGQSLSTVPVDDAAVLKLFEADENGNVLGCADLPEFKSEYVRNIVAILKPKNFQEVAKITAIAHGTGTWEDNGEILVREQGIGIEDIIATRDDVFEYNLKLGLDRNTSYEIAEAVRKGIVSRSRYAKWQNWKKELIAAGAPEWYLWTCEQIKYLFPRAHAISYLFMTMKLGWFKIHFPKEFSSVMKEYEELR